MVAPRSQDSEKRLLDDSESEIRRLRARMEEDSAPKAPAPGELLSQLRHRGKPGRFQVVAIPVWTGFSLSALDGKENIVTEDWPKTVRRANGLMLIHEPSSKNTSAALIVLKAPVVLSGQEINALVSDVEALVRKELRDLATDLSNFSIPESGFLRVRWDLLPLAEEQAHETMVSALNEGEVPKAPDLPGSHNEILERIQRAEGDRQQSVEEVLGMIATTSEALKTLAGDLDAHVSLARNAGVPWRAIGDAIGISATAAHRRWDPEAKRKHAAYQRSRRSSASD